MSPELPFDKVLHKAQALIAQLLTDVHTPAATRMEGLCALRRDVEAGIADMAKQLAEQPEEKLTRG